MIDNGLEINEIENKIKRLKELVEQIDYNFKNNIIPYIEYCELNYEQFKKDNKNINKEIKEIVESWGE